MKIFSWFSSSLQLRFWFSSILSVPFCVLGNETEATDAYNAKMVLYICKYYLTAPILPQQYFFSCPRLKLPLKKATTGLWLEIWLARMLTKMFWLLTSSCFWLVNTPIRVSKIIWSCKHWLLSINNCGFTTSTISAYLLCNRLCMTKSYRSIQCNEHPRRYKTTGNWLQRDDFRTGN